MDYKREHDLDVKIIRIFNTYGPRMALDDGRVVVQFPRAGAEKMSSITIYGDGQQTRSFQYVSDLVAGIVLVMGTQHGDCGPYNVGNPGEFTMLELAELIKQVTNSKSDITFQENTEDDPKQRKPDITKGAVEAGVGAARAAQARPAADGRRLQDTAGTRDGARREERQRSGRRQQSGRAAQRCHGNCKLRRRVARVVWG